MPEARKRVSMRHGQSRPCSATPNPSPLSPVSWHVCRIAKFIQEGVTGQLLQFAEVPTLLGAGQKSLIPSGLDFSLKAVAERAVTFRTGESTVNVSPALKGLI
jgi:hypothetical protein